MVLKYKKVTGDEYLVIKPDGSHSVMTKAGLAKIKKSAKKKKIPIRYKRAGVL